MKKYKEFLNEEVGIRKIKSITKNVKTAEIYFHKDLDGVASAVAIKEFFKTYYDITTVDCHTIQYGGLEFAVKNKKPENMAILVDFAHSKPMFTIATDHHDKQAGAEDTESTYFSKASSNVETISGEISYSDVFTPQDIELIKTVDSANFLKHGIKPEDVQNSIFKYKKQDSAEKNRFMMGFVVNRLLLAYKNKRITVKSVDGSRDHINRNFLECLVLDSTASLYSIFNNIRHYISSAVVSDRAGVLAKPEEIQKNLSDYISRMQNYTFVERPDCEIEEFNQDNPKHRGWMKNNALVKRGVKYDEKYKIISQYGGGNMMKPGSYDRYVPFKNYPEADFICIVWPMGLIQVSCNPFKPKRLAQINLGEIAKEVLSNYENIFKRFYVSLEDIRREYETSQDWKKMLKDEGPTYDGVGFRYSDLMAFYSNCVYKKSGQEIVLVDLEKESGIKNAMNTPYSKLSPEQSDLLKKYKVSAWELVVRNSGGHPSITNIQGINFLKYNKPALMKAFSVEKYTKILMDIAKTFTENLKDKIDKLEAKDAIVYAGGDIELAGAFSNESFIYHLQD